MKDWRLYLILVVVAANSLLSYSIARNTCEFSQYLEHLSGTPNVSQEYAYVKDFMDRNIEVFTLTTALFVAAITFIIGFGFKLNFDRRIATIEKRFLDLTAAQKSVDDDRVSNHNKLRFESLLQSGNLFETIAESILIFDSKVNCRLWAVTFWFKCISGNGDERQDEIAELKGKAKEVLITLVESIPKSLTVDVFNKNAEKAISALIDAAPKDMMPLVAKVSGIYLAEVERVRKL